MKHGPSLAVSEQEHAARYRAPNETYYDMACRLAGSLCDGEEHRRAIKQLVLEMKFLFAGRIQRGIGSPQAVTALNCFVSGTIEDSSRSIMRRATEAFMTMRMGGGIGYDFSRIRPRGALIKALGSGASGPVSFMDIYNSVCKTVSSAGNRRGAQMGVLRVDHPDIEEFVSAKQNEDRLLQFNISVGITDQFMQAVLNDAEFPLHFEGEVHSKINARALWDKIMRSTWDWAEPGVLFLDRINQDNNLWYCETIAATNPCGEVPLPPFGSCLLGSINLAAFLVWNGRNWFIDMEAVEAAIPHIVRAMDNVIDRTNYPLVEQEVEMRSKRRIGIGVTGVANALEVCGYPYASDDFIRHLDGVLRTIRDASYRASIHLAIEKGPFDLFADKYLESGFAVGLPDPLREAILQNGIRNSHLLSIAPTGTISLTADNISSGIEPVYKHELDRTILHADGPEIVRVKDWAWRVHGVRGRTADEIDPEEHVRVLVTAQKYVDAAISKTCNVGENVDWERFKNLYIQAWKGGAKGCTTYREAGKKAGVLKAVKEEGGACKIDPTTGQKTCE